MSQVYLAEHRGPTNWEDRKSNQHKSSQTLVFGERGKLEYPGKNLSEQSREPTNSTHMWRPRIRESNSGHSIGGKPVLSPLRQHCSNNIKDSLARAVVIFVQFRSLSHPINDVKWPVLQPSGRR